MSRLVPTHVTSKRHGPGVAVGVRSRAARVGTLRLGALCFPCALGHGGCRVRKCEGVVASPVGCWELREVFYRADRVRRPHTRLPVTPLRKDAGWCDAPDDRNYNRPVRLPYAARAVGRDNPYFPQQSGARLCVSGHIDKNRSRAA